MMSALASAWRRVTSSTPYENERTTEIEARAGGVIHPTGEEGAA